MTILEERTGDIFDVSADSLLIHACNTRGAWGSGVAFAFKQRYPLAYQVYTKHCKTTLPGQKLSEHQSSLVGTALLIPPSPSDGQVMGHWIACLFTSKGYGKNVDAAGKIKTNTRKVLEDLRERMNICVVAGDNVPTNLYTVRINAGKFCVPWEDTKTILQEADLDVVVVSP